MESHNFEKITFTSTELTEAEIVSAGFYRLRAFLSTCYFLGAKDFAEKAFTLEQSPDIKPYDTIHRSYVIGSIVFSVLFLEAAINEILKNVVDEHENFIEPINAESRNKIAELWETEKDNGQPYLRILDKYQKILTICGKNEFQKGSQPYQSVNLLVRLRNGLVHYKPESFNNDDQCQLYQSLRGKFLENPMFQGSGNPFFPDKCLGSGCALWGVESAKSFADEFFKRMDIQAHYQLAGL